MKGRSRIAGILVDILILVVMFLLLKKFLNIDIVIDNHFNLITVNSVFAGFLFTALSILLSIKDEQIIRYLEKRDFLGSMFDTIYKGMFASLISIGISIINMFFFEDPSAELLVKNYQTWLYICELLFMLLAILYFVLAAIDMKFIINSIRDSNKKETTRDETNKKARELLDKI